MRKKILIGGGIVFVLMEATIGWLWSGFSLKPINSSELQGFASAFYSFNYPKDYRVLYKKEFANHEKGQDGRDLQGASLFQIKKESLGSEYTIQVRSFTNTRHADSASLFNNAMAQSAQGKSLTPDSVKKVQVSHQNAVQIFRAMRSRGGTPSLGGESFLVATPDLIYQLEMWWTGRQGNYGLNHERKVFQALVNSFVITNVQ